MLWTWWMSLMWAPAAQAQCPEPVEVEHIRKYTTEYERLLVDDLGAMVRAGEKQASMLRALPCLSELLGPDDAARVLRTLGLSHYFAGERMSAQAYFASAKAAVPELALPALLAPHPGHDLAKLFREAKWDGRQKSLQGALYVNGLQSEAAPMELPYLRQIVNRSGQVMQTEIVTGLAPVVEPPPRFRFPWLTTLGVSLVVAGGYTTARVATQTDELCLEPDANNNGRLDCPSSVNAQFAGGIGVGVLGASLTTVGLVVDTRPRRSRVAAETRRLEGASVVSR